MLRPVLSGDFVTVRRVDDINRTGFLFFEQDQPNELVPRRRCRQKASPGLWADYLNLHLMRHRVRVSKKAVASSFPLICHARTACDLNFFSYI